MARWRRVWFWGLRVPLLFAADCYIIIVIVIIIYSNNTHWIIYNERVLYRYIGTSFLSSEAPAEFCVTSLLREVWEIIRFYLDISVILFSFTPNGSDEWQKNEIKISKRHNILWVRLIQLGFLTEKKNPVRDIKRA